MSTRLTQSERRRIIELLEREIYDLCAHRLDPTRETYVGAAEEILAEAISAREKIAGATIRLSPLWLVLSGTKPVIQSQRLKNKLLS